MAFIVKKKIAGKEYYYLRESRRENGKIRAITLAYLGKNRKDAEKKKREIKKLSELSAIGNFSLQEKTKVFSGPFKIQDFEGSKSDVKLNTDLEIIEKLAKLAKQPSGKSGEANFFSQKEKQKLFKQPDKKELIMKTIEKPKVDGDNNKKELTIEEIAMFCKRKGFVYPSGEIYGGLSGFWDFGPFGVEYKNNLKREWWNFHVNQREDIAGIDGSIITHPQVWKASGHVDSFSDVSVKCKKCKKYSKVDKNELDSAKCGFCNGELDKPCAKELNLMFKTQVGPVEEESVLAYLRPETAQLIFADFKLVQENARMKLPFGIAQVGKAFRNEISPRDFIFRCREFEQMEIEYFIHPDRKKKCPYFSEIENFELNVYSEEMQKKQLEPIRMKVKDAVKKGIIKLQWHAYWLATETKWFLDLGANQDNFRIRQHLSEERSHYATDTWDLQYKFPFGWAELEGIADRGIFDLTQHEKFSNKDLKLFDEETKSKILPMVVAEPSLGVERAFLVFLLDAYKFDEKRQNIVLKLSPKLAPIKAAIFPIVKVDEKMVKISREIYADLKKEFSVLYDDSGSVGRRYSRNDEIGTPVTITIDEQSLKDNAATLRDRDTTEQVRVKIFELRDTLRKIIMEGKSVLGFGKKVNTRVK